MAALWEATKIVGMIFGACVIAALVAGKGNQPAMHSVIFVILGGLGWWAWLRGRKVRAGVLGAFAVLVAFAALAPSPSPEELAQREASNRSRDAVAAARAEREEFERKEIESRRRQHEERIIAGERLKQIAKDQVRGMMRDPDSTRFGDVRVITSRSSGKVLAICGTVSSTNGFGARVSGPFLLSTESDHVYIKGPDGWSGSGLSLWSQHCS